MTFEISRRWLDNIKMDVKEAGYCEHGNESRGPSTKARNFFNN